MIFEVSFLFSITPVPVQFFPYSKLPIIEVVIENRNYYLELDTGAFGGVILKKEILDQIHKKNVGIITTIDINGNVYENLEFLIPNIKISGLDFESVTARQENMTLLTEGCVLHRFSEKNQENMELRYKNISGRIGWGILEKHRWYFDFFHSMLWAVEDLNELEKKVKYFSLLDHVEVPFEIKEIGIILSVGTNIGMKKMLLDTGANMSCIRESIVKKKYTKEFNPGKWVFLSNIKIGGVSFGEYPFLLYDFPSIMNIDGILSLQFFEKNGIYLDFQNEKALIAPAKRSFWPRLADQIQCFWKWLIGDPADGGFFCPLR